MIHPNTTLGCKFLHPPLTINKEKLLKVKLSPYLGIKFTYLHMTKDIKTTLGNNNKAAMK